MANPSNNPGTSPAGPVKTTDSDLPPSLPLQIFLFCAFLVTVGAYFASQFADPPATNPRLEAMDAKLRRKVQSQVRYTSAISHYQAILAKTPDHADSLNNLALILASATDAKIRDPKTAVLLATRACDATEGKNPRFLDTLARSYAASGDFPQATVWETKAIDRARQTGDQTALAELNRRFALLQKHKTD